MKPNILYLHSHDTGRFIQPYGIPVETPNMMEFAREALVFRQMHCCAPTCSPSRAALLTGTLPHTSGMLGLSHRGFSLTDYSRHIVNWLKDKAGYSSALTGIQHITGNPSEIGYDTLQTDASPNKVCFAADTFINELKEPFFLSAGFALTHREFPEPALNDDPRWCPPPPAMPDTPETRRDFACFRACVRDLDAAYGKILSSLRRSGREDNTIVIITTDHGIDFPRMKCTLYDHGTQVLFMMRGPLGLHGGKVCDALLSHIDVYPTLCDLLDIEKPDWLQGRSFLPVIRGNREEVNDSVFAQITYHATYEPTRSVRTKRWKYIRHFSTRTAKPMSNVDDMPCKDLWNSFGWNERGVPDEELYDLVFDPHETDNRASDPDLQAVLEDMREKLDKRMKETDDPLLKGPVPPPEGARVNPLDSDSPNDEAYTGFKPAGLSERKMGIKQEKQP